MADHLEGGALAASEADLSDCFGVVQLKPCTIGTTVAWGREWKSCQVPVFARNPSRHIMGLICEHRDAFKLREPTGPRLLTPPDQ